MRILILFIALSFSSFSQEMGETKTVKATLTYVEMFDASVVLVFTDSVDSELVISMDNWLVESDIVKFARASEGRQFSLTLEYTEVSLIEWNGSKYVKTKHVYKNWALIKIDSL